jgi:molybdopterin molybdotransferase
MDGYALRSTDANDSPPYRLRIAGTSSAGHPMQGSVPPGSCIRIFTGAAVPDELDAVAIQEDCSAADCEVSIDAPVARGDNIRGIGHDVARGATLIAAGARITQFHLAWLAACGVNRIEVKRRPRVAIFSTGDELVEPGAPIGAGQIFDANRHALRALFAGLPVELADLGILADEQRTIHDALLQAGADCDAIVTTGGVSVGDADHVKQVVQRIGRIALWRLNLKPGKPLAYGRVGQAIFLGLPGNPVSTIVTALILAKPALLKLCGTTPEPPFSTRACLRGHLQHRPGREEFQRGWLSGIDGKLTVTAVGDQSSNRLSSFANANCLIRIPKQAEDLMESSEVEVLPFSGLL